MKKEAKRFVYRFAEGYAEGNKKLKLLLGGKGANLAEMCNLGLPVPPGFTITTETCKHFHDNGKKWPSGLREEVIQGIRHLEQCMGTEFGDPANPLLVSVRSGAAMSMPGMMDTILNLGLNDLAVEGLAEKTGHTRFAYDSYRRLIDMFGNVVMNVPHEEFEESMATLKAERGVQLDTELSADDMKELVNRYKAIYRQHTGFMFPDDPYEQLTYAINAVFDSWNSTRAIKYRKINKINGLVGTAVNIQAMVFGNMGDDCSTGVCFTRNPNTGEKVLYGEFLVNAQGEDVVAGIRTPQPVSEMANIMPDCYNELVLLSNKLEEHYHNMQDIEFTVQTGKLYILQTRDGKRTGNAAINIAVDMVKQHIMTKEEAIRRLVTPQHVEQLLHPQLAIQTIPKDRIIGKGLPASPGAAVGKAVFDPDRAEQMREAGEQVILVRVETSPEDVGGMAAAQAIITSRGGMTSHAAVVARGWGKPCVVGCNDIVIDYKTHSFTNGVLTVKEGEWISLDGTTGTIYADKLTLDPPQFSDEYNEFMSWVDSYHDLQIRTNADTPEDAARARNFGAVGIGLCRTEHMFFGDERILAIRKMILAADEDSRREALMSLLPFQKLDFMGIFEAMDGLPVTIRLLDPPLHEFLPEDNKEVLKVAKELHVSSHTLARKINQLKEFNPMLGHRGCRLGITYPEITDMQTRAIMEAALELKRRGKVVRPEIMVPLVGTVEEFIHQKNVITEAAKSTFEAYHDSIEYLIGTMIEVPRAALTAEKIAEEVDFFSFGTNDLTQMTFGYSRDDAGKFLPMYLEKKILMQDPFSVIDREGVGKLVEMATVNGRRANYTLKVGICGEHGGDPESIQFCSEIGLNYVSCSPYRVPVARVAAAQAELNRLASMGAALA